MFYPITLKLKLPEMSHEKWLVKMLSELEADHTKLQNDLKELDHMARHYCTQKNVLHFRLRSKVRELKEAVELMDYYEQESEQAVFKFDKELGYITRSTGSTPPPGENLEDKVQRLKEHLDGISKDLDLTVESYAYFVQRGGTILKMLNENEFHISEIVNVVESIPAEELFLNTMDLED